MATFTVTVPCGVNYYQYCFCLVGTQTTAEYCQNLCYESYLNGCT